MPTNTPPKFALDARFHERKAIFRDLVKSLRAIAGEKKDKVQEANRPQSRAGERVREQVQEIEPTNPALEHRISPSDVRSMIRDNCGLIKTVDRDKIPGIERRVKRIYEKTNSTKTTLQRYLEKSCGLKDWQAKRIVEDQCNKFERKKEIARLKGLGVRLVRWVHGDCHEPRQYHITRWDGHSGLKDGHPNGLNGFVFDLEGQLPIIDEKRMQRGLPGDAIMCHCRLEPV